MVAVLSSCGGVKEKILKAFDVSVKQTIATVNTHWLLLTPF